MSKETKAPIANVVLRDFDGSPLMEGENTELTLTKSLARILSTYKEDPMRAYLLGGELYKADDKYEIKDSDKDYLVKAVNANEAYFPIVRGQILSILK